MQAYDEFHSTDSEEYNGFRSTRVRPLSHYEERLEALGEGVTVHGPVKEKLKIGLDLGGWFLAQCSYERAEKAYRTAA
jgi:hypothetical protein